MIGSLLQPRMGLVMLMQDASLSDYRLTPVGGFVMICSITAVVALVGFCYYKVLTKPRATEHMHAPLDINTHDRET